MAYSKQQWASGDRITADKLNHIEDGIGDIEVGYELSTAYGILADTTLVAESSEEAPPNVYRGTIEYTEGEPESSPEVIRVTFDNTEYNCSLDEETGFYGASVTMRDGEAPTFDWSVYPFIVDFSDMIYVYTNIQGNHSVKIEEPVGDEVVTSDNFNDAVELAARPMTVEIAQMACNNLKNDLVYHFEEPEDDETTGERYFSKEVHDKMYNALVLVFPNDGTTLFLKKDKSTREWVSWDSITIKIASDYIFFDYGSDNTSYYSYFYPTQRYIRKTSTSG